MMFICCIDSLFIWMAVVKHDLTGVQLQIKNKNSKGNAWAGQDFKFKLTWQKPKNKLRMPERILGKNYAKVLKKLNEYYQRHKSKD